MPVGSGDLLDLTVNNPEIQQVKHLTEEDRPRAVAYLLARGWIILKVLNMGAHQMPKYVLGCIKTYPNRDQSLSELSAAHCLAIQGHSWHIRIRRAWRELLGVASLPQCKRRLPLGGSFRGASLCRGIFLRVSYWCDVVRSNEKS